MIVHRAESPLLPTALDRFVAESRGQVSPDADVWADRLCKAAAQVLPVESVAISVFLGPDVCIRVGASDDRAALAERLHFTAGQGPCLQAYLTRRPVLVRDLRDPDSEARTAWPVYVGQMSARTSYTSMASFPMRVLGSALGVFSLYRSDVDEELDLALVTAVVAWTTRMMLSVEEMARAPREPGPPWLDGPVSRQRMVWRAQGIVMRVHGLNPRQSLNLLRARALASGRLVDELAEDVVRAGLG